MKFCDADRLDALENSISNLRADFRYGWVQTIAVCRQTLEIVKKIQKEGGVIMAEVDQLLDYVKQIDDETNRIASVVEALHDQIASGTLTPDQAAEVNAAFAAEIEKLRGIGKTPPAAAPASAPSPEPAPAPVELTPVQEVAPPPAEAAPAPAAATSEAAPEAATPAPAPVGETPGN